LPAISEKKKFITIAELKEMGFTYYKIGKLEEDGQIKRVNCSTYENVFYSGDENDFFSAEAYVLDGFKHFVLLEKLRVL